MQRSLWGGLIVAHLGAPLLPACSRSAPPGPKPTASAAAAASAAASASASAAASASASAAAPGEPGALGPWEPLTAPQPEVRHRPFSFRAAATDRGVLALARSRTGDHGCAWNNAPGDDCTGFFFAPWKDGKGSPARFPVGATGEFSPVKTSRNWTWIWPGRQGAYALFTQDKKQTLGVLDGQTEQIYEVEGHTIEQIVETAQGPLALWMAGNVISAPLVLQDGKATLGKQTKHRLANVYTAREARELLERGQAPAIEWAAIPNLTDSSELDSAFLLTWSEAMPPERGSPASDAQQRRLVYRSNTTCGFATSRSIYDPSVIKRIMVQRTRYDGTPEGPPREIARGEADQAPPLLRLETRPKVRERLVGPDEQVELPVGLTSPPSQEIAAAGFDVEQKQGVVVLKQAGETVAQLIDEQGKPIGALTKVGRVGVVERRATFVHDGWVVPVDSGQSILVLTGPRAGTEIKATVGEQAMREWSLTQARVVVTKGVARVIAQIESDPGGPESQAAILLGALKKDTRALVYASVAPSVGHGTGSVQVLDSGAIVLFGRHEASNVDIPPMVGDRAWREVIPSKPSEGLPGWETEGKAQIVEVPGDEVLVMRPSRAGGEAPGPLSAVWLRSGTSVVIEGTGKKNPSDFVTLTGGLMGLPATPGQPFAAAAPSAPPRHCVDELAVGPRTRLWLCYKPTGERGWSYTAGVQVRHL